MTQLPLHHRNQYTLPSPGRRGMANTSCDQIVLLCTVYTLCVFGKSVFDNLYLQTKFIRCSLSKTKSFRTQNGINI